MCVNAFALVSFFAFRAIKNGEVKMRETRNTVAACVGIGRRDGTRSSAQYVGDGIHSMQNKKNMMRAAYWGYVDSPLN